MKKTDRERRPYKLVCKMICLVRYSQRDPCTSMLDELSVFHTLNGTVVSEIQTRPQHPYLLPP